jgi:uncharacterized membrane protein YgcG
MSPSVVPTIASQPNIPAWKRLGLKLKSAQRVPDPLPVPVAIPSFAGEPEIDTRKRKAIDQLSPHVKKVKTPAKIRRSSRDTTPIQSPTLSGLKRSKSVTFTPETKREDGDSIKELYNGWIARNRADDQASVESHYIQAFEASESLGGGEAFDTAVDQIIEQVEGAKKPKKEKRAKKTKSTGNDKIVKPTKQLNPALSYLKQFHDSKSTWKFNKIHQIHLLKNAFNVEKIPSEYIELLYGYVAGLKGGARTQLRDAAISIKVKDREEAEAKLAENMDNATKEQEFEAAFKDNMTTMANLDTMARNGHEESALEGQPDTMTKHRMAKRMRAERILTELAEGSQGSSEGTTSSSEATKDERGGGDGQKRLKLDSGSTQKLKRKRKQRTNAVDDSSSSDSSDSSDSESSSEDEAEAVAKKTDEDTTSSSSSSSTSSESENESDSSSSEGDGGSDGSE